MTEFSACGGSRYTPHSGPNDKSSSKLQRPTCQWQVESGLAPGPRMARAGSLNEIRKIEFSDRGDLRALPRFVAAETARSRCASDA